MYCRWPNPAGEGGKFTANVYGNVVAKPKVVKSRMGVNREGGRRVIPEYIKGYTFAQKDHPGTGPDRN